MISKDIFVIATFAFGCILQQGCAPAASDVSASPPQSVETSKGTINTPVNPALEALWSSRSANTNDFPIGPGDVLDILVPGVKELQDQTVRVDGNGDIALPLLGTIHAAGLSESELDKLLVKKLGDYLYHPQAEIFVKSYSSRQVSVSGAVRNPGTFTLNGPDDTVRKLIQRAGGIADNAGSWVILTPNSGLSNSGAESSTGRQDRGHYKETSYAPLPGSLDSRPYDMVDGSSSINGSTLVIDLGRNANQQRYLDIPVRPEDSIFIPLAGSVSTVGWVYRPQTMQITNGLTVLGAIAASGDTLFAADQSAVKIVRRQRDGEIKLIDCDIASIRKGQAPDVPLRDGDIVDVPYSTAKIPGYAVYYALQGLTSYAPAALLVGGL